MTTALQSPSLINDFADFLRRGPSEQEIIAWRPSAVVEERYIELTEKNKEDELSPDEGNELESFLNSEILLSLLKARLRSVGARS